MSIFKVNTKDNIHKVRYINGNIRIYGNPFSSGLSGIRYIGYHNDNPSWFTTATPHGDVGTFTNIDNFSSSLDFSSEDNYSWQWLGYFKPSTSEDYTFYTYSDDGSYLWIGEPANTPSVGNAIVNNGGPHGPTEASGTISLTADLYYPLRIQFGEIGGGDTMTVSFSTNTISKTTDGTGFYFSS